jgi:hypothetical protein
MAEYFELDSSRPGKGHVAGYCEHSNEPLGSINGRKCIGNLNDYYLLKKNSIQWSYLVSVKDNIWS